MTQPKKSRPCTLAWIDMEMTGLDPKVDHILEIALILTDDFLNIIFENTSIVIHQKKEILENMNDWCLNCHQKTGLIEKVHNSTISIHHAEQEILSVLKKFCQEKKTLLCGNSIEQDRRFIIEYMPHLDNFLHYRHVNVSSFKEMISLWYPNHPLKSFKKKQKHIALEDIKESIKELKHYKKYFFIS